MYYVLGLEIRLFVVEGKSSCCEAHSLQRSNSQSAASQFTWPRIKPLVIQLSEWIIVLPQNYNIYFHV